MLLAVVNFVVRVGFNAHHKTNMAADLTVTKHETIGSIVRGPEPISSSVQQCLKRVGASLAMGRTRKLVELLNFLVETTLMGDSQPLKETTIGASVFGYAPDYDPKTQPTVRSQVRRLRTKLSKYYASEGSDDPVVISIPKGQYATVFSFRRAPCDGEDCF